MKRTLVALAALTAAAAASAQSSVTVFGILDAGVSYYSNKTETALGNSITTSQTALTNSGYNSSRLGFRGTEDLGGGLSASFWLEAGLGNDDGSVGGGGNQMFNRRSTVSLSSPFGELRLGRDYVPTFWNDTVFDPFGTNGVGTNVILSASGFTSQGTPTSGFGRNPTKIRASNSIGYFLPPNLGGFYGQVMYAFDEKVGYDPDYLAPDPIALAGRLGRYVGGRVGYANGPLDVALAYGESTIAATALGSAKKITTWNVGASYDFDVVKVFGEYSGNDVKADNWGVPVGAALNPFDLAEPSADGWLLGATVPVGPGLIRMSYGQIKYDGIPRVGQYAHPSDPKVEKFALGYVHNLSKRTALYATVAYLKNKNGADLTVGGPLYFGANAQTGALTPKDSTGYDFGIRHAF